MLRARALVLLVLLGSAACRPKDLPVVDGSNRDLAAGRMIYERKCVSCHGKSGDGKTITVHNTGNKPFIVDVRFRCLLLVDVPFSFYSLAK